MKRHPEVWLLEQRVRKSASVLYLQWQHWGMAQGCCSTKGKRETEWTDLAWNCFRTERKSELNQSGSGSQDYCLRSTRHFSSNKWRAMAGSPLVEVTPKLATLGTMRKYCHAVWDGIYHGAQCGPDGTPLKQAQRLFTVKIGPEIQREYNLLSLWVWQLGKLKGMHDCLGGLGLRGPSH